jgi:cytoskeletal protein CcmA (bactofilin family)
METDKATLIDAEASVEGRLTGKNVRILGKFKGEVEVVGRLDLGEGARVEAKVLADAVEIGGELSGEVMARAVVLLEKARVSGSIDAQTLVVREGAQLTGTVDAGGAQKAKR